MQTTTKTLQLLPLDVALLGSMSVEWLRRLDAHLVALDAPAIFDSLDAYRRRIASLDRAVDEFRLVTHELQRKAQVIEITTIKFECSSRIFSWQSI